MLGLIRLCIFAFKDMRKVSYNPNKQRRNLSQRILRVAFILIMIFALVALWDKLFELHIFPIWY